MCKRKISCIIFLVLSVAILFVCAAFFSACEVNVPSSGTDTEQGGNDNTPGGEDGDKEEGGEQEIAVVSVTLNKLSLTLKIGESETLTVMIQPSNATDKSVTWTSSNTSVATVSNGKVTAEAEGTATITVKAHNGQKAKCVITVKAREVKVDSVTFDINSLKITQGKTETITATIKPANAANQKLIWSTSDESVATVDNGVITALVPGTAMIMASAANGKTATCIVTVTRAYKEITISPEKLYLTVGDTSTFTYKFSPSGAWEKVVLKTENPEIISIGEGGVITATGVGSAIVYIETDSGLRSDCTVECFMVAPLETPQEIDNWTNPAYSITQTAIFSELNFRFQAKGIFLYLQYNLIATKTYCIRSYAEVFKVNYKIKNSKGVIMKSGTITTPKFAVNETVACNDEIRISSSDGFTGDEYTIELSAVAW